MSHSVIHLAKDEKEKDALKGTVQGIAHEVYEFADETVAHTEGVSREELMLECYHKLGKLLSEWGKKLDKIERVNAQPAWLKEHIESEEKNQGRTWVELGRESFGFEVDGLFFAQEKNGTHLSEDLLMVSEPFTMWMEDFKGLVHFCDQNGLDFYVDGFNTHLPGRTMRVVVYKPKSGTPHTHQEFRESALLATQIYERELQGKDTIAKSDLIDALINSGKFGRDSAERVIATLVASGRIPKTKLTN
jgi:hypothetical protein